MLAAWPAPPAASVFVRLYQSKASKLSYLQSLKSLPLTSLDEGRVGVFEATGDQCRVAAEQETPLAPRDVALLSLEGRVASVLVLLYEQLRQYLYFFVLANLNSRADEKGEDELVSLEQTAANILVHEVGDVAHEDLKPRGQVGRVFAHLNAVIVQFFEVLERILRSSSGVSICIFVLVKQRS